MQRTDRKMRPGAAPSSSSSSALVTTLSRSESAAGASSMGESPSPSSAAPPPTARRGRVDPPPPGDTGTHWTGPCEYLLQAATRANIIRTRRHPLVQNPESLAVQLQRYVHFEGNHPPNRQILIHLRLLTYYPPVPDILPELVMLLSFENGLICRLAHYHIRQAAPIKDPGVYRDLLEALDREVVLSSPARRAAATKTLSKVFAVRDVSRAIDIVNDVFKCIGGARVKDPSTIVQKRKVAGISIPGTDVSEKQTNSSNSSKKGDLNSSAPKKKPSMRPFLRSQIVIGTLDEEHDHRPPVDDGAGGTAIVARGNAEFVKSKFGKMLVAHSVFAALRRINRIAASSCRVEAYFFNSGLMSVVPSTVRHCMALLELRADRSPEQVANYLVPRLPHRNPPADRMLQLEDLGAKVYFARLLGTLAEDPNLAAHVPEKAGKKSKRSAKRRSRGTSRSAVSTSNGVRQDASSEGIVEKASNLFKFLFNKDRVAEMSASVRATSAGIIAAKSSAEKKVIDPRGVDFAEALVNLLKNPSNRVLIEALRSLSYRRWTTWCEAPVPQSALYNSPELADPSAVEDSSKWGIDDDDGEGDDDEEEEDVAGDEDDNANGEASAITSEGLADDEGDPDLVEKEAKEKQSWLQKVQRNRRERHVARIQSSTPFYLRKLGEGVVPALEVILRRLYAAMLHDETIRRFAAVDAVIALARAKLYGHSLEDHEHLRRAQLAALARYSSAQKGAQSSKDLVVSSGEQRFAHNTPNSHEDHPFEPLLAPLLDLMNEDSNHYVRGRAAIALAFVLAAGAGRKSGGDEDAFSDRGDIEDPLLRSKGHPSLLARYFGKFVTQDSAGHGVGLRLVSDVIDYLIYELLDLSPDLAPSSIEIGELWASTHPTIGVCGRLGALWEKVLSLGGGQVVGESIFRAMTAKPHGERVASAAAIFLRRRTLDLAIITVGTNSVPGVAVPEPLPRAIMIEMEKYFSLLWHSALLGPSAECRTLCIEALGGAATLAGDPLRVCAYERLVELVRVRGLGLKIPAENVMDALDVLYFCRERFSEARHNNGIARNGTNRSTAWLQIVWRLAAEASSAAQVLLGVPPPTGWQPLGPGAAADVANAEARFGDVRDRHDVQKLKDSRITREAAPGEASTLILEAEDYSDSGVSSNGGEDLRPSGRGTPALFYEPDDFSGIEHADDEQSSSRNVPNEDYRRGRYERHSTDNIARRVKCDDGSRRSNASTGLLNDREDYVRNGDRRARARDVADARGNNHVYESDEEVRRSDRHGFLDNVRRRASDAVTRKEPGMRDDRTSQGQEEEGRKGGRRVLGDDKLLQAASFAPATAARLFKSGLRSGGNAASKAGKLAKSFTNRGTEPP